MLDIVVLDLDGTPVDSVPVHVLAWQAAFRDVGLHVPSHRLQRLIGMGGDRLVTEAAGESVEQSLGDELRARHPRHLAELFDRIQPAEGAASLLESLRRHRVSIVLASSGDRELTDRLLGLVEGGSELLDEAVTGSDAERSKPSGQLVATALASVRGREAVVVGDAVWDVLAARDAGVPAIGLLTGGISSAELRDAGAVGVYESPGSLAEHLEASGSLA